MAEISQRNQKALILELRDQMDVATSNRKVDDLKGILTKLKNDVVITEELIRETKIGLKVGKLRNNENKEIAGLAKNLVKKWKEVVDSAKGGQGKQASGTSKQARKDSAVSNGTSTTPPTVQPSAPSQDQSASPAPGPSNGVQNTISCKPVNGQPRTNKTDGLAINVYNDPKRDKPLEMIYNALVSDSDAAPAIVLDRAKGIEAAVFSNTMSDKKQYAPKMRSLFMNLKDPKNPQLRQDVINGVISVKRLVVMKPSEMASKELKEANEKMQAENLFNAQGAQLSEATTDMFQCKRCRQWKTTYYQMQTRSADEPMTTFVTCTNCGNRWKF